MLDIRKWSIGMVALVSALWVFVFLVLVAAFVYFQFRAQAQATGSGGIGAVIGVGELFALLVLFSPPIVLTLVWYFIKRT